MNVFEKVVKNGEDLALKIKTKVKNTPYFKRRDDYVLLGQQIDEIAKQLKDPRYVHQEQFLAQYREMLIEGIKLAMPNDYKQAVAYTERLIFIDDLCNRPKRITKEFDQLKKTTGEAEEES